MSKITLLNGITADKTEVLRCFNPKILNFKKGEIVLDFSSEANFEKIYIVESGSAVLTCLDTDGHSGIIESYNENDLFGELFVHNCPGINFTVTALCDCRVLRLDYPLIMHCCKQRCEYHTELLGNLFRICVHKTAELSAHISIISQRSIRLKLLTFLNRCSEGKRSFKIPYKISELADYLCVDRCAMLRELKKMREEGILDSKGREFFFF